MGSKYPILKDSEITKRLRKLGFRFKSQNGSHAKYVNVSNDNQKRTAIVPMNGDVPRGTLQSILEQADLSLEEFMGKQQ